MIGVGSDGVNMNAFSNNFCSMLGVDAESWGLSYIGHIHHANDKQDYCARFGKNAVIGVHLDMWHGTLTFFKDQQSLGQSQLDGGFVCFALVVAFCIFLVFFIKKKLLLLVRPSVN